MLTPASVTLVQLARFCVVGLTCYVLNILALAGLCELAGMNYVVAYIAVFLLGNALGYWLNSRFTFALGDRFDVRVMVRYLLVNCALLALSTVALYFLVESLHVWYLAAVAIIAALSAPVGFVAHRVVSYRVVAS